MFVLRDQCATKAGCTGQGGHRGGADEGAPMADCYEFQGSARKEGTVSARLPGDEAKFPTTAGIISRHEPSNNPKNEKSAGKAENEAPSYQVEQSPSRKNRPLPGHEAEVLGVYEEDTGIREQEETYRQSQGLYFEDHETNRARGISA